MNSVSSSDASSWLDNVACAIVDVFQVTILYYCVVTSKKHVFVAT
jgi:hypothetical protein